MPSLKQIYWCIKKYFKTLGGSRKCIRFFGEKTMNRIFLLIVLSIPIWLTVKFDAPKWCQGLSVLAFLLFALPHSEEDEVPEAIGKWLLLFVGIGGIVVGLSAWALRGTSSILGELWWVGPIALFVTVVGFVRVLRN